MHGITDQERNKGKRTRSEQQQGDERAVLKTMENVKTKRKSDTIQDESRIIIETEEPALTKGIGKRQWL